MTDLTPDVPTLRERAERFLVQCGPCDGGLPMECSCSPDDPRPVIADLLDRLEAAEGAVARVDIESVLSAHLPLRYDYTLAETVFRCTCGNWQPESDAEAPAHHRTHLATALRAALAEVTP